MSEVAEFEDVTCIAETALALLCIVDEIEYWVPKSQVHDDSDVYAKGHRGKLVVTEWWAVKAGLV